MSIGKFKRKIRKKLIKLIKRHEATRLAAKKLSILINKPAVKKHHSHIKLGALMAGLPLILSIIFTSSSLAAGSWLQTDWNGGSGSSTTNQYSSASNIETSNSGQISLTNSESLSNTGFESDLSSWSTSNGFATPTLVQAASVRASSSLAVSATLSATPTQGNTLIAIASCAGTNCAFTTPSGWSKDLEILGSNNRPTSVYRKAAGSGESTSLSIAHTINSIGHIDLMEFSGLAADPLDQTVSVSGGTSTLTSLSPGTTSTTTTSRSLALAAIGFSATVSAPSWNNSFVAPATPATWAQAVGYKALSSTQTVTGTASWTNSVAAQAAIVTYKAAEGATATRDTSTFYAGGASAKLVTGSGSTGTFLQSLNVGDTNTYNLTGYAYTTGAAVTSADVSLYYDGAAVSTSYTSVGSGWYKLSATITGAASAKHYGVQVAAGKTLYLDDMSVNRYATTGTLTSNIFDTQNASNWGNITYTSSGSTVTVKVRSSNSATMSGATSFGSCTAVASDSDISSGTGGCVTDTQRYIQYEVTLAGSSTTSTPTFQEITINYVDSDTTPPDVNASDILMYRSNGGDSITEASWTNADTPYFSWTAGQDNGGGVGLKGYCLYLGTDSSADPVTTKGLLGTSPVDTGGACQFAVSSNNLDLATATYLQTALSSSDDEYYINIKAIDLVNNVFSGASESFSFKFDNTAPNNPAYVAGPSNFISSKTATLTWAVSGDDASSDDNSGVAGLQYRIGSSGTWYGDSHNGAQDSSDLLADDGSYTTQSNPDFPNLVDGSNVVYFRTWDNAGNATAATVTTVLKINTSGAPSAPRNVDASPSTNTQNSFAFSWLAPATFVGQGSNLTYCYTVNTLPTAQTCTYTAAGVTSLSAAPYATQPGTNTFYVVAKDESGSINYATAASVEFTANTPAPGVPLDIDIADTSVKVNNNWRLVISWGEPTDVGAGVSNYQLYRSTNGTSYSLAGSTSGLSYVDTGLSQQLYYYKVKACDSANNCGAFSAVDTKTPTGRFTSAAGIVGQPRVEDISTRGATIKWSTDRDSDSKVAFGTSSGNYVSTEAYNSDQTTEHSIQLSNLATGKTYFYVVKWTDEDGNTGISSELAFQTLPPPVVEEAATVGTTLNTATLQYTTVGASLVKIYYGKTGDFGGLVTQDTSASKSTYTSVLTGLDDGTKYFYKVNTIDSTGNEYDGTTLSFTTPPSPKITNLRFQPVANQPTSTQEVTWETNVASTTELVYGVRGGATKDTLNPVMTTKHSAIVSQLLDNSEYTLVARSRDESGNVAVSDTQVFKTALDTRAPVISDITIETGIVGTGSESSGQIIISWKTDEPATSRVAYGEGASGDFNNSSSEDNRLTFDHAVIISSLPTSRVFHLQPISLDDARNNGAGETQTAIIGKASASALNIIFDALQKIFGVDTE